MFGKKFIDDVRSGATRFAVMQILSYLLPILSGGLVVVAALLQSGLPWAYVIGVALTTSALVFAGIATGLNQFSAWQSRLREDAALTLINFRYDGGIVSGGYAIHFEFDIRNHSNFMINYRLEFDETYLQKPDKTNRRHSLEFTGNRNGKVGPLGEDGIKLPAIAVQDLIDDPKLEGQLTVKISYGKDKLRHVLEEKKKILLIRRGDRSYIASFVNA